MAKSILSSRLASKYRAKKLVAENCEEETNKSLFANRITDGHETAQAAPAVPFRVSFAL